MWHTTIRILQDGIRIYDIPCKVNMMLDDTSVILLMNWEAQEWKLKMYSSRLYDQVLKVHYLGFTVLPAAALTLRWLMSYTYGAPILDVSSSHTTTQHSR